MKAPLFLLFATLLAPLAHAGAKDGGGGAQIVAAFRMKAYALISKIGDDIPANALCSSSTLQNALDSANVRVVDVLMDPRTNQPVADKSLDAWTIPGDVQLKSSSWAYFVDPKSPVPADHSVSALVLHEVYRATGSCDDDKFQLSEKAIAMLGGHAPAKFTEAFEFKYTYASYNRDERTTGYNGFSLFPNNLDNPPDFACDKPAVNGEKVLEGAIVTCLSKDGILYQGMKVGATLNDGLVNGKKSTKHADDGFWFAVTAKKVQAMPEFSSEDLDNQWQDISPAHPWVVMHDITNGKWTWALE